MSDPGFESPLEPSCVIIIYFSNLLEDAALAAVMSPHGDNLYFCEIGYITSIALFYFYMLLVNDFN